MAKIHKYFVYLRNYKNEKYGATNDSTQDL